jgi:cytochrome oxidase assembly protein ShyY1
MGHCDVSTTQIYLNLTDSDTQQAHRQFSPIVNLFGKGLLINHGWVAVVE